jgi:hypothetical protein
MANPVQAHNEMADKLLEASFEMTLVSTLHRDSTAKTLYKRARRKTAPSTVVGPMERAKIATTLGVPGAVIDMAEQEFVAEFPRYGLQQGAPGYSNARVRGRDALKDIEDALGAETLHVSTPIAKACQRFAASGGDLLRHTLKAKNGDRPRDRRVKDQDVHAFHLARNVAVAHNQGGVKRKAAFNGDKVQHERNRRTVDN